MARTSTYKLREKSTGRIARVNQSDYQRDLGRWKDWKRVGETRGADQAAAEVSVEASADDAESGPAPKPRRRRPRAGD